MYQCISATEDTSVLRQVKVPLVNLETCKRQLWRVRSGMMCAGYLTGGKDACQVSSGGKSFFTTRNISMQT